MLNHVGRETFATQAGMGGRGGGLLRYTQEPITLVYRINDGEV